MFSIHFDLETLNVEKEEWREGVGQKDGRQDRFYLGGGSFCEGNLS